MLIDLSRPVFFLHATLGDGQTASASDGSCSASGQLVSLYNMCVEW